MDQSKVEKAKVFTSKIPMMKRAVKPSNEVKVVESKIPMIRRAVKPSTKPIGNKDSEKANIARKYSTKSSACIKTAPSHTQVARQTESRKNAVSAKTVSKKHTSESTNKKKEVCEVINQNNSKKSSVTKSNTINRRLTNVNHSMPKVPTGYNKNILNQKRTNCGKIETKSQIGTQFKRLTINAKQQTTRCNNKETEFKKLPEDLIVKSIQDCTNICKDTELNQRPTSSMQGQPETSAEANDNNNLNHFSQQNIEFVADEKYRQQILSGKELTPVRKPFNTVKSSSIYERSSLYKSSRTPFDINTALKRLQDEGRRISMMKMNNAHLDMMPSASKYKRESLFKSSQTPFDINAAIKRLEIEGRRSSMMKMRSLSSSSQLAKKNKQSSILKAIENVDHAPENYRASIIKGNPLFASPHLERNHLSAKDTFLKRLEALQMKKKVKSSKKVTFNLETSGSSGNVFKPDKFKTQDIKKRPTDDSDENYCLTSNSVHKTSASEPQSSTESPEKLKRDLNTSHYNAMLLRICGHSSTTSAQNKANFHLNENTTQSKQTRSDIYSHKPTPASSLKTATEKDFTSPSTPTLKTCAIESFQSALSPVAKMSAASYSAISQTVEPNSQTYKRSTNSIMASSALRNSLYLSRSQAVAESGLRRNTLSKLCTPKPVSFYPHANKNNEISPECMDRRTSCIVANAPISTPMVLRNLAESFEETPNLVALDTIAPVCQRLDFDEIAKETNDDALHDCGSSNELQKRPVQNIVRRINIIDQVLDQECCEILENAAFSVILGRRLFNPVAQILSQGDDMHFIPLKLT